MAIFPLIKLREIITTWKYDQGDGIAELITLLGVLALGIEEGIALGVIITNRDAFNISNNGDKSSAG
jgi:SulP family sulfate permease